MSDASSSPLKPDLEGLEAFELRSDRSAPLHFVGRGDETRRLGRILDATARAFQAGDPSQTGNTQLITAAPGAGKTALLEELAGRWEREGRARIARLKTADLREPRAAMRKIALQLDPDAGRRFGVTTGKSHELGASYVGHAVRTTSKHSEAPWPASMGEIAQWLAEEAEEKGLASPPPPLAVLVDEVQTVAPLPDHDAVPLREAHEGIREYPVLLVLAGLGDSPGALAKAGISRLARNSRIPLGGLNPGEPEEAVRQFFDEFRVRGGQAEREAWAAAIAADSCGWPQHLACGLAGAAEALAGAGGDLGEAALEAARARAAEYRADYYGQRVHPFQGMPELLAEVFSELKPEGEAGAGAIRKAITRAYTAEPGLADAIPRAKVFSELLRKGLIHERALSRYVCPIPSLKRYVEDFCAAEGFPVAAREAE